MEFWSYIHVANSYAHVNHIIPQLYKEIERRVKYEFRIVVMKSLWISTASGDYLSINIHFVDQNYKLKHTCIEVTLFEISHTGESIAHFLVKKL